MKVFLAAQLMSNGVASALNLLENDEKLKDKNFEHSSATATFCRNFNNMFDLLNVRTQFSSVPSRMSITRSSLSDLKKQVDEYVDYIEKLEVNYKPKKTKKQAAKAPNSARVSSQNKLKIKPESKRQSMKSKESKKPTEKPKDESEKPTEKPKCKNQEPPEKPECKSESPSEKPKELPKKSEFIRKYVTDFDCMRTGFVGFIISLKNLYNLAKYLIESEIVNYLLSYKLS